MNFYKRKSRHLSPVTKTKISNALKGRSKTQSEKDAIRDGMLKYWGNDANFPEDRRIED